MKTPYFLQIASLIALSTCAHAATTLTFDFGAPSTANINTFTGNQTLNNPVIDGGGNLTGVSMTFAGSAGTNGSGTETPSLALALFAPNTTKDSLYGTNSNSLLSLTITGLSPTTLYSFEFGASRMGAGGDNRSALYTINGLNTGSAVLNASENSTNTVSVNNITPTAAGGITIDITKDAANTNSSGFYYIGGMQMTIVPEPSVAMLGALGALALLRRKR